MNTEELLKNISSLLKKHEVFLNNNPELFYAIEDRLVKAVDEDYDLSDYPVEEKDPEDEDSFEPESDLLDNPEEDDNEEPTDEDPEVQTQSIDEDENDAAAQFLKEQTSKPKDSGRSWKPRDTYSPEHQKAMQEYAATGYTPREAERMAGAHNVEYNRKYSSNEPSQAMLDMLKPHASKKVNEFNKERMGNASMEMNPVMHATSKGVSALNDVNKDYDKDYGDFLNSDKIKNLKGKDRRNAVESWKDEWHTKNPEHQSKAAEVVNSINSIHGDANNAASQRRQEEIQAMIGGGGSEGGTTSEYSQAAAGGDEGPMSSQSAGQIVGAEQGDEGGYSTNVQSNPYAALAVNNPKFVEHLRSQQAKLVLPLDAPASEQKKLLANIPAERKAQFTPEQRAKFDAHVAKLDPQQKTRLASIPDPTKGRQ